MATTSATSATSTGNIDVPTIVSQLMTVEQRPLTQMDKKIASYQAKISAYGAVKGSVSAFQASLASLSNITSFQSLSATSSNSSAVTATASATATAGVYSVNVSSLAQAQSMVAPGQTSQTAAIGGAGPTTISFDFGTISGNTLNSTTGKYGTALSATTTSGSTTITTPTANLAVGASISGAGIPTGATIASITDANNLVLSVPATATGTGVALQANATFTSSGSGVKTVSIDSSNNSLQGIRDAINSANIGVSATIVNDGSSAPYRLVLTSSSGVANSMKISVAGSDAPSVTALSGLLAEDPAGTQNLSQTSAAQNANFTVNGVSISKSTNTVTDAISGVSLNLQAVTTSALNVTVVQNTSTVSSSVSSFVKAYNSLSSTLKSASAYNASTGVGAILQGDSTVLRLQSQMHAVLNNMVNTGGTITSLSQIGVTFQKDGSLALDNTKLNTAITNHFSDIGALFAAAGNPTDSLVSYNAATDSTKAGSYSLSINALAAQGGTTGSVNLNTVNDGVHGAGITYIANGTTLSANVDGATANVALTAGSYTATNLATMIQSALNGTTAFAGSTVTATINSSGHLSIMSNMYSSTSGVSLSNSTGTTVSTFMGTPTATPGADVSGSIGGGSANGSGQYLTATGGNASGMQLKISGGTTGSRGTVNYSHGYAYSLNALANSMLATGGLLDNATNGLNRSISDINNQEAALNIRLTTIQANYTKQFTALDVTLGNMNSTSTYLTQQLANLSKA